MTIYDDIQTTCDDMQTIFDATPIYRRYTTVYDAIQTIHDDMQTMYAPQILKESLHGASVKLAASLVALPPSTPMAPAEALAPTISFYTISSKALETTTGTHMGIENVSVCFSLLQLGAV